MNLLLAVILAVSVNVKGVPFTPMTYERLPELNIPREAHRLEMCNGEFTVFGGHTTGFVSTPTAEYFRRGKWHTVQTLYPHDAGFAVKLRNGEVMLGGGYEKTFGVGQTWGVEVYDPAKHRFSHRPILAQKRTHATALEMPDGRILVAGNWYAPDAMETFSGGAVFSTVKPLSYARSVPYVLLTGEDNVYVIGDMDNYGEELPGGWVDQLQGEPFQEPLLQEWILGNGRMPCPPDHYATGEFSYLIPVSNAEGQHALLQVDHGRFSLLETASPLPEEGPWGSLTWEPGLTVEPESQTAWMQGFDADNRLYLMRVAYNEIPAVIEVFYSDPLERMPHKAAALALPDGDYLMAGGFAESTYDPLGDVLLFHTQPQQKHIAGWWWLLAAGAVGCIGLFAGLRRRKKADEESAPEKTYPDLQERIVKLMEQEQLFRKPDLRIADIATRLHTNTTYISACINSQMGLSFPRFVTQYRIRFAQQQMKLFPDKKLSSIIDEAGFASENSFFRSFKAETGCTPAEWKQQQTTL